MRSHSSRSGLGYGVLALALAFGAVAAVAKESVETGVPITPVDDAIGGRRAMVEAADPAAGTRGQGARYNKLLRQLPVPEDQKSYGDYYDYGYWTGTSYAGQTDLPAGYWVYITPNWYIFGEAGANAVAVAREPRNWGPEQVTGAPNTPDAGDHSTAWASRSPDDHREWLELRFDQPIKPVAVLIHETYNPGAVDRVRVSSADGTQHFDWKGVDPISTERDKGTAVIPVAPSFEVTCVRVELDSPRVKGWNEIDAVGLLDEAGVTHWATAATASSTYGEPSDPPRMRIELGSEIAPAKPAAEPSFKLSE